MAKKITYLFGAGASANTIPIVADMHERIIEVNKFLKTCLPAYVSQDKPFKLPDEKQGILEDITQEFDWLIEESKNSYSLDTLAKQFYLTGDHNGSYERLKKCLIIYFTIEQFCFINSKPNRNYFFEKKSSDKRYDSFIASISNRHDGKLKLNNNIRIFSWNYDLQFELCLKKYTNNKIINEIKKTYQIFPLLNQRQLAEKNHLILSDEFILRKLNGNAVFTTGGARQSEDELTIYDKVIGNRATVELLDTVLDEIGKFDFSNNVACRFFNFSWEAMNNFEGRKHEQHSDNIIEAEKIASETEILVVIDYSFPIFNREIDNRLFTQMNKLEKVYIQDKHPENIKSAMESAFKKLQEKVVVNNFDMIVTVASGDMKNYRKIPKVTFQLESNTNQFVIPYELNQED